MKFRLKRTRQCKKCPWRKSTNPFEIPYGYNLELHKSLISTIAQEGVYCPTTSMACHHSRPGKEQYCIGWLYNQLGPGNNIGLRLKMMHYKNVGDIQIFGDQHEKFEDTLPKVVEHPENSGNK